MGSVQRAVLEFDEEVRVPWRPLLVPDPVPASLPAVRPGRSSSARPGSSRVGACRPPLPGAGRAAPSAPRRPSPALRQGPGAAGRCQGVAGRTRPPRLRPTRRARRLAVVLALAGGVAIGAWLGHLLADGGGQDLRLAGVSSVVVESGDTLWSIAASVAEGEDVRVVVDRLQELNGLSGAELAPGQVLQVP